MFFSMTVSPDYLEAPTVLATVARDCGKLDALVISQMTVSQMTATSTTESHQQRLHWLSEQVLNWSGLPVVHIRPTAFLDNAGGFGVQAQDEGVEVGVVSGGGHDVVDRGELDVGQRGAGRRQAPRFGDLHAAAAVPFGAAPSWKPFRPCVPLGIGSMAERCLPPVLDGVS
jgi:hypothetical protein